MVEVKVGATLYTLLLTTVIFLSAFVLIVQMIPSEAYSPYKDYAESYVPEDLSQTNVNVFSYYQNITLTCGDPETKIWFNETEVHFDYFPAGSLSGETNATLFVIEHFEWAWWIMPSSHSFTATDGTKWDFNAGRWFTHKYLLRHYDNETDTAVLPLTCGHISLKLTFTSNSSSYTLPEALQNRQPVHIVANWEYDFSSMGANMWTLLGSILTFQSIKTGVILLDTVLNSLIAIPVWTSIMYIMYKLITGLIPLLSGGSGA